MVRSNFQLTASDTVLVVVYVSGGGKGNDPQLPTAYNKLLTLNKADVTQLKMAKKAWWKDLWTRSYVETTDELLNRHYLSSGNSLAFL